MSDGITHPLEDDDGPAETLWAGTGRASKREDSERQSLAQILNLIRNGTANTRLELERISGLGRAIVADRLETLNQLRLIDEDELGHANGGRAPRTARFRESQALYLVAVLEQGSIGIAVSTIAGKLLLEHHEPLDALAEPAAVLKRLHTLFDWALEQHRKDRDIWGIGIALSGPVETSAGQPFASPHLPFMPGWEGLEFVESLVARYGAPCWVRSKIEMMTAGELLAGSAQGAHDMLFVDLSREISAGLVLGGKLFKSDQGRAGLVGHIAVGEDTTTLCKCGNVGCLEAVAGADAVARLALQAASGAQSPHLAEMLQADGEITAMSVGTAALMGDTVSAELLSRSGRHIGNTLAALTNSFNPSLIVIGGTMAESSDILLAAIREAVYRRSHPLVSRDLRIVRSKIGASSALIGLARSVADEVFAPNILPRWILQGSPVRNKDTEAVVAAIRTAVTRSARNLPPPFERTPA
ncbi:MAG: ROK family protein [Alphaproteobacteria bacterium]|nr:ROK family protein [Alphaproteobacteria bacterium]